MYNDVRLDAQGVFMNAIQLDFTVDKGPVKEEEAYLMRLELKKTQEMSHNVRRAIFARLSEQEKLVLSLREEVEQMRAIINEFKEKNEHTNTTTIPKNC